METRRWTNPTQPQTLQIAVILLYINAVIGAFFGTEIGIMFGMVAGLLFALSQGVAAFGIANEKRWGYALGIATAAIGLLPFGREILSNGVGAIFSLTMLIALLFPVALFALLVHPQSRDYQRIWFS